MSSTLIALLRRLWPWWIVAAVLLLACGGAAYVIWRRRGAPASKVPASPPSLTALWRRFVGQIKDANRGLPLAVVVGPARSGKTTLITGLPQAATLGVSSCDDPRMGMYQLEDWLVQELSSTVLEDERREASNELRALCRKIAWQARVLVLVVDVDATGAAGLAALGRRVRSLLDDLTSSRARPIHIRVCVTHVDRMGNGFASLLDEALRTPPGRSAPNEARLLDRFVSGVGSPSNGSTALRGIAQGFDGLVEEYWVQGLRAATFGQVIDFERRARDVLIRPLEPLLEALLTAGSAGAPVLDGVSLMGRWGASPLYLLGDPLSVANGSYEKLHDDLRASLWRVRLRRVGATVLAVLAVLSLTTAAFAFARRRAAEAQLPLRRLEAESHAPPTAGRGYSARFAREAAQVAARLRSAPAGEENTAERQRYRAAVRRYYLLPAAQRPETAARAAALALYFASKDDPIEGSLRADVAALASRTEIPRRVVEDYLSLLPEDVPVNDVEGVAPLRGLSVADLRRLLADVERTASAPLPELSRVTRLRDEARTQRDLLAGDRPDATALRWIERLGALRLPVNRWFGDTWALPQGALDDARAVLDTVAATPVEVPAAAGATLGEVEAAIAGIASAVSAQPVRREMTLAGQRYVFDEHLWTASVASSRATGYLEAWLRAPAAQATATFVPPRVCPPQAAAATAIPCEYTGEVAESSVRRPLASLGTALASVPLPAGLATGVTAFVVERARLYDSAREAALDRLLGARRFDCMLASMLATDVAERASPTSGFARFIQDFSEDVRRGTAVIPDAFQSIVTIGTAQEGRLAALEPYLGVLRAMLPRLAATAPGAVEPGAALADRVSPLGGLSLAIVAGGDASARAQVVRWLDAQRVPERYRRLFLDPVDCAYRLGIDEVEGTVAVAWRQEIGPDVERLWGLFPFRQDAEADALADDIEATLGPQGTFATRLAALLGPVAIPGSGGTWRARRGPDGRAVSLPAAALSSSQRAFAARSMLFTPAGERRPLTLSIRAETLPWEPDRTVPIFAALRACDHTVSAFNQGASWQTLTLAWGTPCTAGIALRTSAGPGVEEGFASLDSESSDWSLHRLLARANPTEVGASRRVAWSIQTSGGEPVTVAFTFRQDPWSFFGGGR